MNEIQEIATVKLCTCYENESPQMRARGDWQITAADDFMLAGSIVEGSVFITEEQKTQLTMRPEFDLNVMAAGYQSEMKKYPGDKVTNDRELPIKVDIKKLTPTQRVEVIRENARERNERARQAIQQRFPR